MIDLNDAMPPRPGRIDLDSVMARLRDDAPGWAPRLFPNGRREGDEWRLANIRGDAPRKQGSCVITLVGERAGEWFDFDGNQGGGILNTLEQASGLSGRDLLEYAAELAGHPTGHPIAKPTRTKAAPAKPRDDVREIELILSRAVPARGALVETYLASRGIAAVDCPDLLFHPDLTHWDTKSGWPAMVAVIRDATGIMVGLHRTWLAADGTGKAPFAKNRKMLGKAAGGAVRLAQSNNGLLGLAEGIETTLAVMRSCPALPSWAALSAGNLETVALPPEIKRVVILADHDASGAGRRAAETAAARLHREDRKVWIAQPPNEGDDFNDLLMRDGVDAVRTAVEAAVKWTPPEPTTGLEPPSAPARSLPNLPVGFPIITGRRSILRADNGDLADLADRSRAVLAACNQPPWLFRMGAMPAWVTRDDDGRAMAVHLSEERLKLALARIIDWRKKSRTDDLVPAYPPAQLVKALLATPNPDLPVLAGIVAAPVFGRSGELVTKRGYHPACRLLHEPPEGFQLPPIPEQPTLAQIAAARSLLLDDLLGDFPFTSEAERAHALALLLLSFVRPMIDGPTPLHLIEKPSPGTGATLLVDAIAIVATGCSTSIMTEAGDEEEWRKRLTAKLREAPLMAVIDNLHRPLEAASLAAALTAPYWEDRILGRSDITRMPVHCAWVATGNNPRLSNEIARRSVRIRLDAHVDRPWRRNGFRHPDLLSWVRANRATLVAACLTLGRAWVVAGRPRYRATTMGSFESWAETMGGILDVVGVPGFLANSEELYESSDAEGIMWRSFVAAWWDRHGTTQVGAADLFQIAGQCEPPLPLGNGNERSQRTRLGKSLGHMRDRVFAIDDLRVRIRAAGVHHQAQRWELVIEEQSSGRGERGERGERFSGHSQLGEQIRERGELGELGERFSDPHLTEKGERADQRSHLCSPAYPIENKGSGERGERGERFSLLTHARTHAHAHMCVEDTLKRSPRSPCSPTPDNSMSCPGEHRGERDFDVPPVNSNALSYDAVFDAHGLDPLSDEDRARAMTIWLSGGKGQSQ
ncbi:MAG: ATPase [Rhodospirillales bacterium RIFCSPLOWO2_02_FULL_58_16]|nr:MAG: ATPase [Rhodospirillales bacterium RIFCSPLOWO2_02_FULL_58_16]